MKYSQLPIKTLKENPHDADNIATALLIRAGFVSKVAAGVYAYQPLGLRVLKNIEQVVREEMNAIGASEILMPALSPRELWEKTGRWDDLDVLYKVGAEGSTQMALGATHEEVVTPLVSAHVQSYRDLPVAVYQIQTKFRNEPRAKAGLMRGREFLMKDLYSFHTSEADLDQYYEVVTEAYQRIYARLGIGDRTYLTFASGGTFAKFSHEFQTITEAGEDEIYLDRAGNIAVNEEVIDEEIADFDRSKAEKVKASEVGNIFKLMTKYSAPFEAGYMDESGKKQDMIMGCYGIGISRLMGVIAEVLRDDRGLVWPASIAPYQVHLIFLGRDEGARAQAEALYADLTTRGIEVFYDDRDEGAGAKLADADLFGIPTRVVLSDKSLAAGGVEVKRRSGAESQIVAIKDLTF